MSVEFTDKLPPFRHFNVMNNLLLPTRLFCFVFVLSFPAFSQQQASLISPVRMAMMEDFREPLNEVPCKNEDRLPAVKSLFEKMGATEANITIEKIKDVENIVIRKPGASNETIFIGAHYDFTGPGSCGAIDNWTGIVTIAQIYRTVKDMPFNKTLVFVGFGKEENGLVGSKAMVKQFKKEEIKQYCAMINVDSLGLSNPQVMSNISNNKLEKLAKEEAQRLQIPFQFVNITNASSDSASFSDKKIPALTIASLPSEWSEVFHTKHDQSNRIKIENVYLGYKLALSLLLHLDQQECGAYR